MIPLAPTVAVALLLAPPPPPGFSDLGQDLRVPGAGAVSLDGALRARGELFGNLDLDRGLTPSGQPLFPVSLSDPSAQVLTHADMRLRVDLVLRASASVAVKARVDVLDDTPFGDVADHTAALRVKRAYGEALLPVGLLAVGRMGSHWGLGLVANAGECADCDSGDFADRVALVTPLLDHIFAVAYDLNAGGPFALRRDAARAIDLDPADDVRSITFALLRWRGDAARARRRAAGKTTLDYGAFVAHRWQREDVPGWYLPTAQPQPALVSMARGLRATAGDAWLRVSHPWFRLEAEAALVAAVVDQPSLIPGVLLPRPVESLQAGGALESDLGAWSDGDGDTGFAAGLDLGVASGDPAPGFGAFPHLGAPAPQPGDLDGAQAAPPGDYRVDNFRFHPDYRVDRILFHELIGTVTDAMYARPHARLRIAPFGAGALTLSVAVILSRAVFASSTPGGAAALGVEIDPTVTYETTDGFALALEHAVFLPQAGLDNPAAGLAARPAQLLRARVSYRF